MTQPLLDINIGASPGDGTGDPLRTGFTKINTAVNKIGTLTDDGKFVPAAADDFDLIMKRGGVKHAEIVIDGSNNFLLTVSPDGLSSSTALSIAPATGLVAMPNTAGVANGLATLDGSGKVPVAQIPASVAVGLRYQGTWNASTNTPALVSGAGTSGYLYKVSVSTTTTTIDGVSQWDIGDFIFFDGTVWNKVKGLTINASDLTSGTLSTARLSTTGSGNVVLATSPTVTTPAITAYAWSSRPSAPANTGAIIKISDVGKSGSFWVSDGIAWYPMNGHATLAASAIPMILPSSGSIANNGALTGLTALATTYANCYMYFPVNAIATGVAAGLYYVIMSSTTAGTIYNNTYTSGLPVIPPSPTAFVTTGPGAYTQTTGTDITLISFSVLANLMGLNGLLNIGEMWSVTGNTDTKTLKVSFGSSALKATTMNTVSLASERGVSIIRNSGLANSQISWVTSSASGFGTSASYPTTPAEDTTANVNAVFAGNIAAVATNYIVLNAWSIELLTP
ncbi:MAG: hypothetical protein ACREC4_02785 [Methylocella sp.]